jgi:hypothetical protein
MLSTQHIDSLCFDSTSQPESWGSGWKEQGIPVISGFRRDACDGPQRRGRVIDSGGSRCAWTIAAS